MKWPILLLLLLISTEAASHDGDALWQMYEELKDGNMDSLLRDAISTHIADRHRDRVFDNLTSKVEPPQVKETLARGNLPWDDIYHRVAKKYSGIWHKGDRKVTDWQSDPDLIPFTTTKKHEKSVNTLNKFHNTKNIHKFKLFVISEVCKSLWKSWVILNFHFGNFFNSAKSQTLKNKNT